ncbi:MAG: MarR family winged helix-turn-helix transcriptional regulator [Pseudomonadales bacterium]
MLKEKHKELSLKEFFPYQLSILASQVSEFIAKIYADEFGLNRVEWRIVASLGEFEQLSATEICKLTALEKMQVSRAIGKLRERALLMPQPDLRDGRSQRLALTRDGLEVYRQIVPLVLAQEQQLLAGLSAEEQAALRQITAKLSTQLRDKF